MLPFSHVQLVPTKQKQNFQSNMRDFAQERSEKPGTFVRAQRNGDFFCYEQPLMSLYFMDGQLSIQTPTQYFDYLGTPVEGLREVLHWLNSQSADLSLLGGLAYEAHQIFEETVVEDKENFYDLPDILFSLYRFNYHYKSSSKELELLTVDWQEHSASRNSSNFYFGHPIDSSESWQALDKDRFPSSEMRLTRADYIQRVEEVRSQIYQGEIYQGNFTHQLRKPKKTPAWEEFCQQFASNPADQYVYWNLGGVELVCASPELFLKRIGDQIVAHPIKGTIARQGHSANELLESKKDDAELSMIVDLFRNDMNRICRPGTVSVSEHKSIIEMTNVYHLYSEIVGQLKPNQDSVDCLKALFPSGSITGCPKIRSIEVLQNLEGCRRSFYTGSLGHLSLRDLDLNVAIRTQFHTPKWIYYHVGGGIVFDSDPEMEYKETIDKALPFLSSGVER